MSQKISFSRIGFRVLSLLTLVAGVLLLISKTAKAADITMLLTQDQQQVSSIVNQQRALNQENGVQLDPTLCAIAQAFAYDMYMRSYFSHVSPEGTTMGMRLRSCNAPYGWAGENIALGQKDSNEVMTTWMNSKGHRDNILNTHFNRIGVGHYGNIWVEEFTDGGLRVSN